MRIIFTCLILLLLNQAEAQIVFIIQGTITALDSGDPLKDVRIELENGEEQVVSTTYTTDNGSYKFQQDENDEWIIQEETDYNIHVYKEGFFASVGAESTKGFEESVTFIHDFGLAIPPKKGVKLIDAKVKSTEGK